MSCARQKKNLFFVLNYLPFWSFYIRVALYLFFRIDIEKQDSGHMTLELKPHLAATMPPSIPGISASSHPKVGIMPFSQTRLPPQILLHCVVLRDISLSILVLGIGTNTKVEQKICADATTSIPIVHVRDNFVCRDVWDQPFSWFCLDWKYLHYIGNLIIRNTTFRRWKILVCFTFLNTQRYTQPSAFLGNLKNIDPDCALAKYCIHIPLETSAAATKV